MKPLKKIILTFAVLIATGLLFMSFTFRPTHDRKIVAKQIQNYIQENIAPVMKPNRQLFEQTLSASEKTEILQLRKEFRELARYRKENGISLLNLDPEKTSEYTIQQQEVLKESRDRMRKLVTRTWIIADNHEKQITSLLSVAKDKKPLWKTEIRKIFRNNAEDRFLVLIPKRILNRIDNLQIPEYFAPVAFILWDPEKPLPLDELIK